MKTILVTTCLAILAMAGNFTPLSAADSTLVKPKAADKQAKVAPATKASTKEVSDTLQTRTGSKHQLIVYYFHGTQRCSNCIKIEAYTKEAIDSAFSTQLKDSVLVWRLVNTDEDANKHCRDDYQLFTKSVVLSDLADGKQIHWKNLDKIWEHLGDKAAFQAYIREEVAAYLKAD